VALLAELEHERQLDWRVLGKPGNSDRLSGVTAVESDAENLARTVDDLRLVREPGRRCHVAHDLDDGDQIVDIAHGARRGKRVQSALPSASAGYIDGDSITDEPGR
jgi:hypothetical protein